MENKVEKLTNKEEKERQPKQMTYADIAKDPLQKQQVETLKSFIKAEKEEERWINLTKCNIMVYDLGENENETKEEQRVGDKKYVEDVFKLRMKLNIDIVKVERIGARSEEKFKSEIWRPLKVTLKSEEEKRKFIASSYKLAPCDFKISEDFSIRERKIIKEWHEKARKKTMIEEDERSVWKVRGSPRTKLYIKKFHAKNDSDN